MQAALAALLPVTLVLAAVAAYPAGEAVAPVRLALIRGAIFTGTVAVLATEGLGALHQLTGSALIAVWLVAAAACGVLAGRRLGRWLAGVRPSSLRPTSLWLAGVALVGMGFGSVRPTSLRQARRPGLRDSRPRPHAWAWLRPGAWPRGWAWLRRWTWLRRRGWVRGDRWVGRWGWVDALLVGGLVVLAAGELVVALVAPPNNADSMGYHLPRVEHWVQDRSVGFYPTAVHRQIGFSPGAEYLLLQVRLLAGPEEFANLVQWAAALGCAVVVSRIAAQLGAGRRGQLVAAATAATAPLVVLEATSTQTDLVAAFWTVTGIGLALAGWRARASWAQVGWLGAATGLTAVTKVNALATLAPFLLLWAAGQLVQGRRWVAGLRIGAVGVVAVALVGPFTVRCAREWGTVTGDPGARIIALGRHDPAAVGVNAARIAASVLATGAGRVDRRTGAALDGLATALHLPARDPTLTFTGLPFRVPSPGQPDEDHSGYPIQALAVLGAVAAGLLGRRRAGPVRGYSAATALALLLTAALVAWQPWINRLVLPTFIAGAPLAGWAAGQIRLTRRWVAVLAALVVLAGYREAAVALWYGQPRPLGGPESVLLVDRDRIRYARGHDRQAGYEAAAAVLAASGARRIGLVQTNVGWEYPWWEGPRRYGSHPEVVSLTSVLPRHPPASAGTVDAIVCTLDSARCRRWLPDGWRAVDYGGVSVMLPAIRWPVRPT
jgi:hypothetical protein